MKALAGAKHLDDHSTLCPPSVVPREGLALREAESGAGRVSSQPLDKVPGQAGRMWSLQRD